MTLTNVEPRLLAQLDRAKLPVITGRGHWVLVDFRGIAYEVAKAIGFELEPCQGMASIDFSLPANKATLVALVQAENRRRLRS